MKKTLLALTVILSTCLVFVGSCTMTDHIIDDAVAQGAASAAPIDAVKADPLADPAQTIKVVREFGEREALWATVALVVFLGALALSNAVKSDKFSFLSFLKSGRWPAILAGVAGCSGAAVDYAQGNVTYMALVVTALTAVAALLSPSHVPKKTEQ